MYLPSVERGREKTRRQIVEFGGLDRTQRPREGALTDCLGLSWDRWPCLSQRAGRKRVKTAEGVADLFAWETLWKMRGATLYRDEQQVVTLTPGKKRFAVVGAKLCVFPDKVYVDLDTLAVKSLEGQLQNGAEVVFDADSVTFTADLTMGSIERTLRSRQYSDEYTGYGPESYLQLFKVCDAVTWNAEDKTWTKEGEEEIELWWGSQTQAQELSGKYLIFRAPDEAGADPYTINARLRHKLEGAETDQVAYGGDNTQGLYAKILEVTVEKVTEYSGGGAVTWDITFSLEIHDATRQNDDPAEQFAPGDRVVLSGCALPENNTPSGERLTILAIEGQTVRFALPEGVEQLFTPGSDTGEVTMGRQVPDLDLICADGNRLFGVNNATGTVYASALGDPGNFYVNDGRATDSYAQTVSTDGDFVGCCAYSGSVLFFKEDCVHRLVGSYPAAYTLYTDCVPGLQRGSGGSLALVGEALFYKGRDGIYTYTGASPKLISECLGDVKYTGAVGGGDGRRYYVSMKREDTGAWELLVYDTRTELWTLEDHLEAAAFTRLDGTLYLLSGGELLALGQGEDDEGTPIPWEAAFAPFDESTLEEKRPSRLLLRLELAAGAWAEVELARDGGLFQNVWTGSSGGGAAVSIPIRPGRCDSYQIRLKGEGRCLVRSMAREFTLGGAE